MTVISPLPPISGGQLPKFGWVIRNDSKLPVIVFDDKAGADAYAIAGAVEKRGHAWLGRVDFVGRSVLRACTTSFLSETADIDLLISELNIARQSI